MEVQQLVEWFGGLGLLIFCGWMAVKKLWAKIEDKDKLITQIAKDFEATVKNVVKENQESVKEIATSNQKHLQSTMDDWYGKFKQFTEDNREYRQQNKAEREADRNQMKVDREEGRQVLKEHNTLIMATKDAVIQINGIVQRTESNVQQ